MNLALPPHYKNRKLLLYEAIGAALVLLLLIIKLSGRYIHFHFLTDTLWVVAPVLLVLPELSREKPLFRPPAWLADPYTPLLLCLYSFLFHSFIVLFRLRNVTFEVMLYAAAAVFFGMALFARARELDIIVRKFDWKNLLRYPHWPMTLGTALCMLAPFFRMTRIRSIRSSYGMVFGYDYNYGWGYNNWGYNFYGYNIAIKGHLAYWGHFACILLAFMLIFHLVRAAGNKNYPRLDLFFKIAIPVIFTWWLLGAKGYNTLKSFGNILFLAGLLLLTAAVFFPGKLGELIKKKGILP